MGTNGPRFLVAGLEGQNLGLSNDVVYLTSAEEGEGPKSIWPKTWDEIKVSVSMEKKIG